ncbi:MAG: agmatine deiminase family protein [Cytophagales bacterium]|mgnify:CR=1 FL=1|nr:agmatine deiminase family protein [Cytophagales bacterium]
MTATPKDLGFHFPAEFEKHDSTWLSWPHKEASWPGKLQKIYQPYSQFVRRLAQSEKVNINVADKAMMQSATAHLKAAAVNMDAVAFHYNPTNDAWCRDHGPAFLVNRQTRQKVIVDWGYNAWGGKYPPFDLDDVVPTRIANDLKLPVYHPGIVMEGGSVDFNGTGTILTTTSCLLNKNRNPHLTKIQIEKYLLDYYGADHILWLHDGIVGDDTDGHIDDITRFVNKDTVVTVVEDNSSDENFEILKNNVEALRAMRLPDGRALNIIELPMPSPVVYEGQRLPASYANFYIGNGAVIVPTFRDNNDRQALETLQVAFPAHEVVGIDSVDIIWGLGSFHCLSQQEPSTN